MISVQRGQLIKYLWLSKSCSSTQYNFKQNSLRGGNRPVAGWHPVVTQRWSHSAPSALPSRTAAPPAPRGGQESAAGSARGETGRNLQTASSRSVLQPARCPGLCAPGPSTAPPAPPPGPRQTGRALGGHWEGAGRALPGQIPVASAGQLQKLHLHLRFPGTLFLWL